MKNLTTLCYLGIISIFLSCGGGGKDTPDPVIVNPPTAATLTFPLNNEECNTGESINSTQSKVNFEWNVSTNTTSYTLVIRNLLTNTNFNTNTTSNFSTVTLNKNTPYKWWVVSKNSETTDTAKSSEWKFYNSGDAIKSYAPFPAEVVNPSLGSSISVENVTLEWNGSDVDGDIKEYDVYFGTVNPPTELLSTTSTQKIESVVVNQGNTYYWNVITKDNSNNSSTSEIFQFKIID